MKRNQTNKHNDIFDNELITIGYKDVYDDYDSVDIQQLLGGIPSIVVLKFVASNFRDLMFTDSYSKKAKEQLRFFCNYNLISKSAKEKIWSLTRQHKDCLLYETYGCSKLYGFVLQNYVPLEEESNDYELCRDEYESVFKAILYCNQLWLDAQLEGTDSQDLTSFSLRLDLPVSEFKYFKDFKPPLFKAFCLAKFMYEDEFYRPIVEKFCLERKVSSFWSYLIYLFNLYIKISKGNDVILSISNSEFDFVDQFSVDIKDCDDLFAKNKSLSYLRDHFLITLDNKNVLILNPNFIVDKLYQSIRFELFKIINKYSIINKRNKLYKGFEDFNNDLSSDFSERVLFYSLMQKIFIGNVDLFYTGEELKAHSIVGEPDLLIVAEDVLFLFEFKDVMISESCKNSNDVSEILNTICNKICTFDSSKKRKGAGQLYQVVHDIIDGYYSKIIDLTKIKSIIPIVVTTDRAFSAIGVQRLLVQRFVENFHLSFNGFISVPIVIELDTIIDYAYKMHSDKFLLQRMISEYLNTNYQNIASFSYFANKNKSNSDRLLCHEETQFLYGEFGKYFEHINK